MDSPIDGLVRLPETLHRGKSDRFRLREWVIRLMDMFARPAKSLDHNRE